jgi:hypothetical protein
MRIRNRISGISGANSSFPGNRATDAGSSTKRKQMAAFTCGPVEDAQSFLGLALLDQRGNGACRANWKNSPGARPRRQRRSRRATASFRIRAFPFLALHIGFPQGSSGCRD